MKPPANPLFLPFRQAKLNACGGDLKKRWYIEYYAYHADLGKMVRKRLYEINRLKSASEREAFARKSIKSINALLNEGFHLGSTSNLAAIEERAAGEVELTAIEAMASILEIKAADLRPITITQYGMTCKMFGDYLRKKGMAQSPPELVTPALCQGFVDYLSVKRRNRPFTVRGRALNLTSVFSAMVDREIILKNPWGPVKLPGPSESILHVPLSDKDLRIFTDYIRTHDPFLWRFLLFLFYGFMRPNEIMGLQIKCLDPAASRVHVPGSIAKNKKAGLVYLSPPFKAEIEKMNLAGYPPSFYIFSKYSRPGKGRLHYNYFRRRYNLLQAEMKKKGIRLDRRYTLYSWKHTGVIKFYESCRDIKAVQLQCRHSSIEMTNRYLQGLGFVENKAVLNQFYTLE